MKMWGGEISFFWVASSRLPGLQRVRVGTKSGATEDYPTTPFWAAVGRGLHRLVKGIGFSPKVHAVLAVGDCLEDRLFLFVMRQKPPPPGGGAHVVEECTVPIASVLALLPAPLAEAFPPKGEGGMAEAADEFFYVLAGVFVGRADHLWGEGGHLLIQVLPSEGLVRVRSLPPPAWELVHARAWPLGLILPKAEKRGSLLL